MAADEPRTDRLNLTEGLSPAEELTAGDPAADASSPGKTGTEKNAFWRWLDGELDVMDAFPEAVEIHDDRREMLMKKKKAVARHIDEKYESKAEKLGREGFLRIYLVVAVISCVVLIGVLLYAVANLPRYGRDNPKADQVVERYVEKGLEETGAINIVSGMILDYRAFDTLGESHVLFTALICVMILLRKDQKNMRSGYEDYYKINQDRYFGLSSDVILRRTGMLMVPIILLYGIYILLNGQNSPGGGFSGGAIIGAGMIIFAASFGLDTADRVFTWRFFRFVTLTSLAFYSFAKGYVFFTGANGIENGIGKGTPGAILSGGLILPLDIAVGLVVACTMFGFYSLFRRGNIGGK